VPIPPPRPRRHFRLGPYPFRFFHRGGFRGDVSTPRRALGAAVVLAPLSAGLSKVASSQLIFCRACNHPPEGTDHGRIILRRRTPTVSTDCGNQSGNHPLYGVGRRRSSKDFGAALRWPAGVLVALRIGKASPSVSGS